MTSATRTSHRESTALAAVWKWAGAAVLCLGAMGLAQPAQAFFPIPPCFGDLTDPDPTPAEQQAASSSFLAWYLGFDLDCMSIGWGIQRLTLPVSTYGATERLPFGTGGLQLDWIEVEREIQNNVIDMTQVIQVDNGLTFAVDVEHYFGDNTQDLGTLDPGAGFALALQGAQGGPSGAVLGLNPQNIIRNARYEVDVSSTRLRLDTEWYVSPDFGPGIQVAPFGGFVASKSSTEQTFQGDIPGYTSSFRYETDIDSKSFGVHIGGKVSYRLPEFGGTGGWQTFVSGYGSAGLEKLSAELRDTSTFGGTVGGVVAPSTQSVSLDEFNPYYNAGARVDFWEPSGLGGFYLSADWERHSRFGVAQRDGTNPTSLKMDAAEAFTFSVGASIRF